MPVVRIEMFPGRTVEQKRALAKAITDSFVEIGKATPQSVQIVFSEVSPEDWSVAGVLVSDRQAAAALAEKK